MSGDWPADWEDDPSEAEQLDPEAEARLSEVTAYLASVPALVLPSAVEARISAALAAEAAARASDSGQANAVSPDDAGPADDTRPAGAAVPAGGARLLGSAPARARVRRHREAAEGRRGFRSRPLMTAAAVVACLILGGVGYGLSRSGPSPNVLSSGPAASSSGRSFATAAAGPVVPGPSKPTAPASSTPTSTAPTSTAGPSTASKSAAPTSSAAASTAPSPSATVRSLEPTATPSSAPTSTAPVPSSSATPLPTPSAPLPTPSATASVPFGVVASGTNYLPATLVAQVRAEIAASGSMTTVAPSSALSGCVTHFTDSTPPKLVDRASYQGAPAYIIASSTRVWVVGLGCTATSPELIVSASLAS